MNYPRYSVWKGRVLIFWEVLLALLFGGVLFVFLDLASAGIFTGLIIVLAVAAVVGLFHYLFWGREMLVDVASRRARVPQWTEPKVGTTVPGHEFFVELNEDERRELLQLLEQAAKVTAIKEGAPAPAEPNGDMRRQLIEKLRMYGAG
jgi:hypothetical protein